MAKLVSIHDRFKALRSQRIKTSGTPVPKALQGISKVRIRTVLAKLSLNDDDKVDCIFALLDDESGSFPGLKFFHGATTAHLGAHINLLQRGKDLKLDREGRDYWIKPLTNAGVIEPVTLVKGKFVQGHVKAKSPNSSYRIDRDFLLILQSPEASWEAALSSWIAKDPERKRLQIEALADADSESGIAVGHEKLINESIKIYAKNFLPGFEVLFVDDSDGQRISDEEADKLKDAGVSIGLEDAFPDVLLWNRESDKLWCIEAVTSDGEVDSHKVQQMRKMAKRCGKAGIGFTTTYLTWKAAASRQQSNRNLADGSFVWIASDPTRQLKTSTLRTLLPSKRKPKRDES